MIRRLYLLAEVLAMLVFLYGLYGEKFRIDYKEVILIVVDLIIMQSVNSGYLPEWASISIYLVITGYCIWRFGRELKKLIINSAIYIVFLSGIQMLCFFCVYCVIGQGTTEEYRALATNVLMLFLCILLAKKGVLKQIAYYLQKNDFIIRVILIIGLEILLFSTYMKKERQGLYLGDYLFPVIAILGISALAVSWQSYKLKAKEREMELQAYKLYEESYSNLISEIRLKQHEFNNHINAVYSQHLICKTYEELVERQKEYCESILYDNRYEKLLKAGNSMLIGFLYGKFVEAEKRNITVEYDIQCAEFCTKLPMYKLVELTGNLLNNAMDALEARKDKRLFFLLEEEIDYIRIEVRNVCEVLSAEQIEAMFQKGYSSKGENRGLGLYSLKKMGKEYDFDIVCSNLEVDSVNWISFSVQLKKSA